MKAAGSIPRLLALLGALAPIGCATDEPLQPDLFARAVVDPEQPLSLFNTQRSPVTWPVWGSAFPVDRAVGVRATLQVSGRPTAGLVFAGPGDETERRAVDLLRIGESWVLREIVGGRVIQNLEMTLPPRARFEVIFEPSGQAVVVNTRAGQFLLEPTSPLFGPGEAVGVYVFLRSAADLDIVELAITEELPAAPELGDPLRDLASASGVTIGTATDLWPPRHDLAFEALLGQQFDLAAPGEFDWTTTRGEDPDFFTVPADLMVNHAAVHDQRVRGHSLVWDLDLPGWLTDIAATGDAGALGDALDDHIYTLVGRYSGRVAEWVVVNEAIRGPEVTGGERAELARSVWSDLLGPGYIERALVAARAADPDAVLLYNETGAETPGPVSDLLHEMAADLVERGVPIDGVGLEFHIDAAAPPDLVDVAANMERFGELGLGVYITELDVNLINLGGTRDEKLDRQAEIFAGLLETCLSVPACRSYTMWGFGDRHARYEREEGVESPLPFDEEFQAKPAFFAIQSVLEAFARGSGM